MAGVPDDVYATLLGVIAGRTAENPIRSKELAQIIGSTDAHTGTPETRALIAELVRRGHAIGATADGYFLIRTEEELDAYTRVLEQRELGIRSRIVAVRRAFFEGPRAPGDELSLTEPQP